MVDIRWEGGSQRSAPQNRHTAHLRRRTHCTPRKLSSRDRGGDKSQPQPGTTAPAKHQVTWAAWTGEGHKMQAQPSLSLWGVPEYLNLSGLDLGSAYNPGLASDSSQQSSLELEQCRLGKHTRCERGQTQCGWATGSTPHRRQWYFFAASLPPHRTIEQVSLKKCPPLPPCVRAEIRHWRDQQTEEAKINRGNHYGSDRCNRLKPCN